MYPNAFIRIFLVLSFSHTKFCLGLTPNKLRLFHWRQQTMPSKPSLVCYLFLWIRFCWSTATQSFAYILSMATFLRQQQSWVIVAQTFMTHKNLKYLLSDSLYKNFSSCFNLQRGFEWVAHPFLEHFGVY